MSNYENLKVWHRAVELAVSIYRLTQSNKAFVKRFWTKRSNSEIIGKYFQ